MTRENQIWPPDDRPDLGAYTALVGDAQMVDEISLALRESTHFIALVSPLSGGKRFVAKEILAATVRYLRGELKFIPVLLEGVSENAWHEQAPLLAPDPYLRYGEETFLEHLISAIERVSPLA